MYPIILNSILVELKITATSFAVGQNFQFNDVPQIRNRYIYGIVTHLSSVDYSTSTQGNPIISSAKAQNSVLTLVTNDGKQPVYQIPIYQLAPTPNGGLIRIFQDIPLDITKSYVTINSVTGFATNDTFAFTVFYKA